MNKSKGNNDNHKNNDNDDNKNNNKNKQQIITNTIINRQTSLKTFISDLFKNLFPQNLPAL